MPIEFPGKCSRAGEWRDNRLQHKALGLLRLSGTSGPVDLPQGAVGQNEAPDLCGVDRMTEAPKPPHVLDAIADKVLAYKPKPKSEAAKKRKKTKRKLEKAND